MSGRRRRLYHSLPDHETIASVWWIWIVWLVVWSVVRIDDSSGRHRPWYRVVRTSPDWHATCESSWWIWDRDTRSYRPCISVPSIEVVWYSDVAYLCHCHFFSDLIHTVWSWPSLSSISIRDRLRWHEPAMSFLLVVCLPWWWCCIVLCCVDMDHVWMRFGFISSDHD